MGPYGPSVEERKRVQLEFLKSKYGDKPYDELRQLAVQESSRKMKEIEQERQQSKTA